MRADGQRGEANRGLVVDRSRMRRALLFGVRVVARAIATIVLLCVGLGAYGFPVWQATPILVALTLVTWAMFEASHAIGLVYEDATRKTVRPGCALVLATAISVPVAFVFGMLDAALLQAQSA